MLKAVARRLSDYWDGAANDDDELLVQMESRRSPRHEVAIGGVLQIAAQQYDCVIRSISTFGMMVEAKDASLCVGQQVLVTSEGFEPLCGIVRWFRGNSFGAQFPVPIPVDMVHRASAAAPSGMRARAGRARVRMPAVARFGVATRKIEVLNISVGGLMMKSNLPFHSGQAMMIEFPDMLPLGGHVRWGMKGMNGFMFTKLLPVPVATEIARRAKLAGGWMQEVRAAHRLAGGE